VIPERIIFLSRGITVYSLQGEKKDLNARNQVKGAKTKMSERKLRKVRKLVRGFTAKIKGCKTKGRKTRAGCTCIPYNGILYESVLRTNNVNIIVCSVGTTVTTVNIPKGLLGAFV